MTNLELCQFLDLGYHIIDSSDIPDSTHDRLFDAAVDVYERRSQLSNPIASLDAVVDNLHVQIPLLNDLLESECMDGAMSSVLGPNYFRYGHSFVHQSGAYDQTYHKDSPLPWGTRGGVRSHRPNWAMVFYYPQAVTLNMGPTEILPGTQYWNVNREGTGRTEGEDRFDSTLRPEDVNGMTDAERTCYFERQVGAFDRKVKPLRIELPKGSLVLVHFDLFHRGTRRISEDERFMYKFWYVRTTEPCASKPRRKISYRARDPRRQTLIAKNAAWMGLDVGGSDQSYEHDVVIQEADRMAYAHASVLRDPDALVEVCCQDDEAERRSAMYALAGHDTASLAVAKRLLASKSTQRRCCATFLLGELREPRGADIETLLHLLVHEPDTDVKMTAINALGRALRRRIEKGASWFSKNLISAVEHALSKARERKTRIGFVQSAERQCLYIALLNIVSSAAERNMDLAELSQISLLIRNRIGDETDRYAKSTALEILARLAKVGDQDAIEASLKVLRNERWSVVGATT